ncbi:MAG: ABC transporter permease, partial [Lachnospiraceae bacterium]|nr:ABC transporter permease [Lachnospiraceae bacterium]
MKNASLVMKKELARVFKDKRMIFSMFILPALIMLVIFNLVGMMVDGMSKDVEEHVSTVYIQNATESAKNVIAASGYDKAAKVSFVGEGMGTIDKIKDEILSGDTDLLVVFDTDFD